MTENKKDLRETTEIKTRHRGANESAEKAKKGQEYSFYIDKVGSLTKTVDYLRTNAKVGKQFLTRLILDSTVSYKDLPKIEKIVLSNTPGFDDHFILSIINTENNKRLTKEFNNYNNLKQLILLVSLHKGLTVSTIRSTSATFRFMDNLETKFNKPFWEFDRREITKTYVEMATKGYTAHTISSKVSLLIKAEDVLRELAKKDPDAQIHLDEENEWYKAAHAPRRKDTSEVIRETGRIFYTKDIIYEGLEMDKAGNAVVPLLIFRGVRLPLQDNTQNEMGEIKVGDFEGNVLTIRGKYPRQITFTDYEMKFIKKLFVGAKPSDYLLRPRYRTKRDRKPAPLKRWALVERRLRRVGEAINVPMKYYSIRQSGELYFVDNYIKRHAPNKAQGLRQIEITKYIDDEERDMMVEALIKCFEQFGVVRKNEVTKEDFSRSPNQERLSTFLSLRKHFETAYAKQNTKVENR